MMTVEQALLELKAVQHFIGYDTQFENVIDFLERQLIARDNLIDSIEGVQRYAPKIIPMGPNPPLFDGMNPEHDGPWVSLVEVVRTLRRELT